MSQRESSSSSSSDAPIDSPLCIICDEGAAGVGPFSRQHLCQEHLCIDVAEVWKLSKEVMEQLRPYSCGVRGSAEALLEEQRQVSRQLCEFQEKCDAALQLVEQWKTRVTEQLRARQEAVDKCLRDLEDLQSYDREVASASDMGDTAEVCSLAMSMQLSLSDLQEDFERAQRLRVCGDGAELWGLRQLQRLAASLSGVGGDLESDAAVTARPETSDAAVTTGDATSDVSEEASGAGGPVYGQIDFSHEVKLDSLVYWLAVCSDTSGFFADRSGRVVPTESAGDDSVALPQPCLIADVNTKKHLTVLSVDGTVKLRSQCDINLMNINGLHCHGQLLFIAQNAKVTVTDLSGCVMREIRPRIADFGRIGGIGDNAASVFVSSGNKIAAFCKSTGKLEKAIRLDAVPDAELCNIVIHENCILVSDEKNMQVHRVRIDTQQVVATHPTQRAGLARFEGPLGVAVDSRGRMFVSESDGHSVRAVAADDGSLLWTLGVPGERGSGVDRLDEPWGLAVVTGDSCEQLVVADGYNNRLLVLNLW